MAQQLYSAVHSVTSGPSRTHCIRGVLAAAVLGFNCHCRRLYRLWSMKQFIATSEIVLRWSHTTAALVALVVTDILL